MPRRPAKGFTLIELLVTVMIIGVLAAVAAPKFSNTKHRATRAAGIADMRNLVAAQAGFFADSNRYATLADTGAGVGRMNFTPTKGNTALTLAVSAAGWSGVVNIPGNQTCGVYSGASPLPTGMPTTTPAGEPACW